MATFKAGTSLWSRSCLRVRGVCRLRANAMWDGYLSANYRSLQTATNKHFSKGLLIKGAYTWSKAINMTDNDGWLVLLRDLGPRLHC